MCSSDSNIPLSIPFCLGLKYQMLIIKLLSGDVLCSSTSDAFEKALSARAGCVGRGRGKAARTLVNRPRAVLLPVQLAVSARL